MSLLVLTAAILGGLWINRDAESHPIPGVTVGSDLHALFTAGDRTFASGHQGAGYRDQRGGWVQIESLKDTDVMGWALTPEALLVGGHGGLYVSTDDGASFDVADAVPAGTDVHALGASSDTVYLSSPAQGLLVSTDGGKTFSRRGTAPAMMGTVLVDPTNPDRAVAPDMQYGAVKTTDGGRSWRPLGGPRSAMSVAWNPNDRQEIVSVGMDRAEISMDGGSTWQALEDPPGTAAVTYTTSGAMMAAVRLEDQARTYQVLRGHWTPVD